MDGEFGIARDDNVFQIGQEAQVPVVVPFGPIQVAKFGSHDVKVYVDGQHQRTLTFYVTPPPLAQAS